MRAVGLTCVVLFALLLAALPCPSFAVTAEEAARQIQLAEDDLAAGNFERAAASAASALRLDPARHDAFVVRGLALQGLGQVEDAAALLRAYRDLRGKLPLDPRVEPALAEIARQSSAAPTAAPSPEPEAPAEGLTVVAGPTAVVFGPDAGDRAAERAYAAARPFLGGEPAVAVLALSTLLPRGDALVVVGADATLCTGPPPAGSLVSALHAAEAAVEEMEADAADRAAAEAEIHLACGSAEVDPSAVARLVAVRAAGRWVAGEPEGASRLWMELFALASDRAIDSSLSPAAQALQLDAKAQAVEKPIRAGLSFLLPAGWVASVDGVAVAGREAEVIVGRRIVRLIGPGGEAAGAVVDVDRGASATVATTDGLRDAAGDPHPDGPVLKWLAGHLAAVLVDQKATAILLVNLATDPPVVRRFDGDRFLLLTAAGRVARGGKGPGPDSAAAVPRAASAALLGGGIAATAVGILVSVLAHGDGVGLQGEMGTGIGFSDNYGAYQAARTREQVGAGIAAGGGVVALAGLVTFVLPQPAPRKEVASR